MNNGEASYRRFLEGDREALGEIVSLYRIGLTYFINRYVRDYEAAEDIAIDTFMYLLVNPKKYNFKASLKTYLYTIGRSRALDYIKHNRKIIMTELNDGVETSVYETSVEEQIIKNETHRKLKDALDTLPLEMQTVLHLVYFDELSYVDAAKVLKTTTKKVDNLLYRAKKLLRDELEGDATNENG